MLSALALAGCAAAPERSLPPLLSIDGARCDQSVALQGAMPIVLGQAETKENEVLFDQNTRCVRQTDGTIVNYQVLRLPPADQPYLLKVRTEPVGPSYLVPTVSFLAADGRVIRSVGADGFSFHGTSLMALFRSRAGQEYLLVQSDPTRVGQSFDQINESVTSQQMTTTVGKYASTSTYFVGSSKNRSYVFSHNGSLHVTAAPIPRD